MRTGRLALAAALAATAGAAAAAPGDAEFAALGIQRYAPPRAAPSFVLPDLDGRSVRLEDLRGQVVLVVFWATWCPDCLRDLPSVNQLYQAYRDRGLAVLLVDFRESPDTVRRAVRERGYVAPVLIDRDGDVTGRVYGVWGPPTAYLLDRGGRLVGLAAGPRDWGSAAARRLVEALLQADPP